MDDGWIAVYKDMFVSREPTGEPYALECRYLSSAYDEVIRSSMQDEDGSVTLLTLDP